VNVTVAIPTWNNPHQLRGTILSLVHNTDFTGRIIVVNNGQDSYESAQGVIPYDLDWVDAGENLGWIGGINEALSMTDTELFCMLNDDVVFPWDKSWWDRLVAWFNKVDIGGVGPASNYVAGWQSIHRHSEHPILSVEYLIGFCAMYRTEHLEDMGGLDASLPGGDDLDLSIRMKDRGKYLVADRRSYLHHYGSQTGNRVHAGYWDSQLHQADTYNAIIRKHGLRRWWEMLNEPPLRIEAVKERERLTLKLRTAVRPLTKLFYKLALEYSDMKEHMETLYRYASECRHVVETGTNDCTSTTALLYAQPESLDCYDIKRYPEVDLMEELAGRIRFTFHLGDVMEAEFPEDVDMWFCDDLHEGEHVRKELDRFAHKVKKYIAFHDVSLFGDRGELGGEGIWPAISDYMRAHPEWRLVHMKEDGNGLAIYARTA
jgi:GT2 family glycosyltransferase